MDLFEILAKATKPKIMRSLKFIYGNLTIDADVNYTPSTEFKNTDGFSGTNNNAECHVEIMKIVDENGDSFLNDKNEPVYTDLIKDSILNGNIELENNINEYDL